MVVNSSQIERKITFWEKKWDFRFFLVWDLFDGQGAWIDGTYQNFLYIQHYFLQIFNSIKPDNLKYYEMPAGPVKIYWVRFEKAYFDKKKSQLSIFSVIETDIEWKLKFYSKIQNRTKIEKIYSHSKFYMSLYRVWKRKGGVIYRSGRSLHIKRLTQLILQTINICHER